ncbi:unnamed protein product [Thelazia callipaeda]|uniref:EF-hand domain-containing protein n=1 Tax=Thelazia callipaeda TaxID=103827 RepID=A0A0N5CTR9_THECL|nr:unnamed protein product [Thelazia callipaeda]
MATYHSENSSQHYQSHHEEQLMRNLTARAFSLYDVDNDGYITKTEMVNIIEAIHSMVGDIMDLPNDENTPEKRVTTIFLNMDLNLDGKLTREEFKQSSKNDPWIVQALTTDIP